MSERSSSPRWGATPEDDDDAAGRRPTSKHSTPPRSRSGSRPGSRSSKIAAETTPLLARVDDEQDYGADGAGRHSAASSLRSLQSQLPFEGKGKKGRRWPTLLALVLLGTIIILILIVGFFAPAVAREYATQALVLEPTDLSIDSFTANGLRARVQATVRLDASRVQSAVVRDFGRFGTSLVRKVESDASMVKVYVPEYGNVLLGVAYVPRIVLDIRNGHQNRLDFLADLEPGEVDGIRTIANDWLEGRLGQLRVKGEADLRLRLGGFSVGTQSVAESFAFEGQSLYKSSSARRVVWGVLKSLTRMMLRPRPPRYSGA